MESAKALSGQGTWFKKLQSLSKKKHQQKTYILPTSFGIAYGFLCLILLLIGMVYANNVVYVICFYLTVMGLGLARYINDNVLEAQLESLTALEIYAGSPQKLSIKVRNSTKRKLQKLELRIDKKSDPVIFDINPEEVKVVEILWTAPQRGYNRPPILRLNSQFPAGLFNAWKVRRFEDDLIVFPQLKGDKALPESARSLHESIGVLREIRDYKPGDSPRRIHWRSLAKNAQLRTMVHESQEGQSCYFSWDQVSHLRIEDKLSQLAYWIQQAHANGHSWSLHMPQAEFESSTGPQVYYAAMKFLALWKETA